MLEINNEIYKEQIEEDYKKIAEKKLESKKAEETNLEKDIKLKTIIDEEKINLDTKKLVNELKILISNTTRDFMEKFDELLKVSEKGKEDAVEEILEYIKSEEWDKPEFTISEGEEAKNILNDFGLSYALYEGDMLLVFQFPKPLAECWQKGKENFQYGLNDSEEKEVIKWGYFYRQLRPIIWEHVETFEYKHKISFNRINAVAQHDSKKYYYVWQVERKKGKQEKLEVVEFN